MRWIKSDKIGKPGKQPQPQNVQHDIHHFIEPRYCLAHTQISQHRRHCLDAEHEHVNVEDL